MESMFEQFFGRWPFMGEWNREQMWNVDMEENDNEIIIRAEAPGFEAKDFEINSSGNMLTIRAEHREGEPRKEGEARKEDEEQTWGYRRFERSLTLPEGVQADRTEAHYRNGVLELHLPRAAETRGHRIEVKS